MVPNGCSDEVALLPGLTPAISQPAVRHYKWGPNPTTTHIDARNGVQTRREVSLKWNEGTRGMISTFLSREFFLFLVEEPLLYT